MASKAVNHVGEVKDGAVSKINGSMQELQQSSAVLSSAIKEGVKRVVATVQTEKTFDKTQLKMKTELRWPTLHLAIGERRKKTRTRLKQASASF
ncbi:hypothetical protein Tco_1122572 [Tanacetum coccineum]|uniref:Uncharacterized protein n=1 Tax=Tanacetum coccineum TaxID=301880 RepID=A0ABQ5J0Y0_9ASTR